MNEYPKHLYRVTPVKTVPTIETITVNSLEAETKAVEKEGYYADLAKAKALEAAGGSDSIPVSHWYDLHGKYEALKGEHDALKAEHEAAKAKVSELEAQNAQLKADAPKQEAPAGSEEVQ